MTRRVPAVGEGAVPDWVDRENRKFEYPFPQPQVQRPSLGGGGGQLSIVVAASDAPDIEQQKADYVCTGTNDQDTINEAFDILQGAPVGGTVQLTSGNFTLAQTTADSFVIGTVGGATNDDGICLLGMGTEATILTVSGNAANGTAFLSLGGLGGSIISGFTINNNVNLSLASNYSCFIASNYARIHNIKGYISGFGANQKFMWLADEECAVWDCNILAGGVGLYMQGTGHHIARNNIYTTTGVVFDGGGGYSTIVGNYLDVTTGVSLLANTEHVIIANNYMSADTDGIATTGAVTNVQIVGNSIIGGGNGVDIGAGAARVTIAGNWINDASRSVNADDSDEIVVSGNVLEAGTGVFAVDVNDLVVTGNQMQCSDQGLDAEGTTEHVRLVFADNVVNGGGVVIDTYSDFAVTGNVLTAATDGVSLVGCVEGAVRGNSVHLPAQHGILLDADCALVDVTDNLVEEAGTSGANTYDGIQTNGDTGLILGNHIIPGAGVSTRYGINIAAGSDNAVYANYLGDSSVYGTADSVDSGTNTQLAPAAGAIGGQFAY